MIVALKEVRSLDPLDARIETVEVGYDSVGLQAEDGKRWWRPTGRTITVEVPVWELRDSIED